LCEGLGPFAIHSLHFDRRFASRPGDIPELQRLTVSLRAGFERQARWLLFSFTGQLDAYSDKQFKEFVLLHQGTSTLPLLIDLTHIDFIDSSGLGVLVQLAKQCSDAGNQFLVVGNARVVQTIKLVRLEEFLHLQSDLNAAISALTTA
jgi:anti-sigma B factor antagonist